jgi:type III pantothenate kinase
MKLIVDCGNTNTSFGVFANNILVFKFAFKTDINITPFELLTKIQAGLNFYKTDIKSIKLIKIASVVPAMEKLFQYLNQYIKTKICILKNDDIKLTKNFEASNMVGIDRILNVYRASMQTKNKNVLVIDFGTATTFDFGNTKSFEGGVICLGIKTMYQSLFANTAKLPLIDFEKPESIVGKNTKEAINSGVYFGYSHLVNGIVNDFKNKHKNFEIFITGGMWETLKDNFNFKYTANNNLTLEAIFYV